VNGILLQQSPQQSDCLQCFAQTHIIGEDSSLAIEITHAHNALINKLDTLSLMLAQALRQQWINNNINDSLPGRD
jgi:hypothetical protein